ncbi:MAG: alpha/beta fold hydrolase [Polyangiaceae bacterium]
MATSETSPSIAPSRFKLSLKTLRRVGVGAAIFYGVYAASVWALHRSIVFPAPRSGLEPSVARAKLLRLDPTRSASGAVPRDPTDEELTGAGTVVALWAAPSPGRPTIVFFHGNGEELVDLGPLAQFLMDLGVGVYFVEYPGYGLARDGKSTEASIYAAAARALDELPALGVTKERTILVGHSLGTGVAVEMAVRGYGAKLVLVSPFTSMVDMVSRFTPLIPTSWVVRDRFDNLEKAPRIPIDTLIVHGDQDTLVPIAMARALESATPRSELVIFSGGGHNDLFRREGHRLPRMIANLLGGTPSGERTRATR